MSLGLSPLSRKTAGLAIPTPIYADTNDSPIDLRKKVVIRRSKYGYDHSNYQHRSDFSSSDEEDAQDHRRLSSPTAALPLENGLWAKRGLLERTFPYHHPHHQPAFPSGPNPYHALPLKGLHPVLSEQYGIQYALFASPEGTHVVPVPAQYTSSTNLPHLRASLAMPDFGKRNYFSSHQRHIIDDDEDIRRHVYYGDEQMTAHRPLKQSQESEFRIRDSPSEDRYHPWRKYQSPSLCRNLNSSPNLVTERLRHLQKCYSNEDFRGSVENSHSRDGVIRSPQERQPRQRLKPPSPPPFQLKRRARSLSWSHLRKKSSQSVNKSIIHPGYSSDNESSTRRKVSSASSTPSGTNGHSTSSINKKRRVLNGHSVDGSDSDSDSTSRLPKADKTLLNLLASAPPSIQKRDSDVLLRQLQRSPVHHSAGGKEGYPWSVYEYYNHLVEKFRDRSFQRSPTDFRPYGGHSSPPAASPSVLIPGLPIDEDSMGREQRKRPTRALTGKHVKHGTGASPSTLITLRQKIQERQRAKELLSMGIDHHHHHQEAPAKIARNGNYKKPKQAGNLKKLKHEQNGNASIRDLRS